MILVGICILQEMSSTTNSPFLKLTYFTRQHSALFAARMHIALDFKEAPGLDVLLFVGHKSHPPTAPAEEYVL